MACPFRSLVGQDNAVTHRGKPPAPPGDSPRFDLYDGPREFLISAKRKEIHDERVPEPEPYEMGLQISRGGVLRTRPLLYWRKRCFTEDEGGPLEAGLQE